MDCVSLFGMMARRKNRHICYIALGHIELPRLPYVWFAFSNLRPYLPYTYVYAPYGTRRKRFGTTMRSLGRGGALAGRRICPENRIPQLFNYTPGRIQKRGGRLRRMAPAARSSRGANGRPLATARAPSTATPEKNIQSTQSSK